MSILLGRYWHMTYDEVIGRFGTQVALAEALGIAQPTVSCWGRVIPPLYQYKLEVITDGALRADRTETDAAA